MRAAILTAKFVANVSVAIAAELLLCALKIVLCKVPFIIGLIIKVYTAATLKRVCSLFSS